MKKLIGKIIRTNDKATEYLLEDTFSEKHPVLMNLIGFVLVGTLIWNLL